MKNEDATDKKCPVRFFSGQNSVYCDCVGNKCMAWALDEGSTVEGHCRIIGSLKS